MREQFSSIAGPSSRAARAGLAILVIAALYFARDVMILITFAVLLAFLLNPLVRVAKRWGIWHVPAAVIVGVVALLLVLSVATLVTFQTAELVDNLSHYGSEFQHKIRLVVEPALEWVSRLSRGARQLAATSAPVDGTAPPASAPAPDVFSEINVTALLTGLLKTIAAQVGRLGVVVVLAGAMLVQGNDLRDRIIRLIGDRQISMTTTALDEAAAKVSRYLLTQTAINGCMGLFIAAGLMLIGMPTALLWGLLWAILRFLPYLGPAIAISMPVVTALGYFGDWSRPLLVVGLYGAVETVCSAVLEPWLYGNGTGLSPLAVLVSALFWGWLWGWVGLLLATPMTVCLVVLGRYVKQFDFFQVLLGDKPVLHPSVRLYQRLLTNQPQDAREIVNAELKRQSTAEVFEQVVIPTMTHLERDIDQHSIDAARHAAVHGQLAELLGALERRSLPAITPRITQRVLCLPARDDMDVLCGRMLEIVCAERGITVEVVESGYLISEKAALAAERPAQAVIVAALSRTRLPYVRQTLRRIADQNREVALIATVWDFSMSDAESEALAERTGAIVTTTFSGAIDAIRFAAVHAPPNPSPAPGPELLAGMAPQ